MQLPITPESINLNTIAQSTLKKKSLSTSKKKYKKDLVVALEPHRSDLAALDAVDVGR